MRDAKDVTVQRTIVHILKHLKQELVSSDAELDLKGNQKLREYFNDQVKNALKDGQTGSARFSPDGDQAAITACYRILEDGKRFIPSSKHLAQLFLDAMGKDERIKPESSCLAVCLYTASNYPSTNFLALIKIDPGEALIEKVETRDGKRIVTFRVQPDVLPTKEVKLRKAALVSPQGKIEDFDLLLLDKQVAAVAANFFAVKFLNSVPVIDPRKAAEKFVVATEKALNKLVAAPRGAPEHVEPEKADEYVQHREAAMLQPLVDLDEFPENLPLPAEAIEVVKKEIKRAFPGEAQIAIDREYTKEILLKKERYVGDYGVSFEVDSDHHDDVVKPQEPKHLPDGTVITRWIIEVPNFRRVR